ncbi:type IV secretion system protein [Xanthomonas sp. A2111]|uniref:Type IV secretion system protein n=1 Tax=Xanthomonas hawaiiensis TaxID=3003247 RepID=A0ABU2IAU3_9XANT|nr:MULTISPECIES: type IV secretion system protein [unclassified Xanthomonas]MBO9827147.1 type IV secretion system protein [Xanthomonas sp. A2111]MBO9874057.1 type IV secretion system protein [Xanthomonas sp. D-93]MDS9994763.1 type IV secretion system protein [Xanthomonas sp. A2111]WNH46439.1 type IV secretion system protein [Xanthomonas sp. A6251]
MNFLTDLGNYVVFTRINAFLRDEIDYFQWSLLLRMSWWVSVTAMSALTLWVLYKGYRVATGQSREFAMDLVVTSLRSSLIVIAAMSMVSASNPEGDTNSLYWRLTDGLSSAIVKTVTGSSDSPYKEIDRNLALMQVGMTVIDQINTAGDPERQSEKDRARMFTGIGMAGPAIVGGSLLLLNKLAMALFVGFGPLFILCLLFDATKSLFQRWLLYGIGTVFSLSVLTFTVALATKVTTAVASGFIAAWAASNGSGEGVTSMSLQQGGIGLVLSTLIITAPPMAASFFQGTLGQFSAYSAFGQLGRDPASGRPYTPQPPVSSATQNQEVARNNTGGTFSGAQTSSPSQQPGWLGQANKPNA